MKKFLCALSFPFLISCATNSELAYIYDSSSRIALVNAIEPIAYYYSFNTFSKDRHAYPVDWGIPELVENAVRTATGNQFIQYTAPDDLLGANVYNVRKAVKSDEISDIKSSVSEICSDTGADALLILGTHSKRVAGSGASKDFASGYGLFTYSGSLKRPYFAYSIPAGVIVNCVPLSFYSLIGGSRSPVQLKDSQFPTEVNELTEIELREIYPAVLKSLTDSPGNDFPAPLDVISDQVAKLLGPRKASVEGGGKIAP